MPTLIGQKAAMFYQSKKHRKSVFYCVLQLLLPLYHKANEEAQFMYYTLLRHSGHLRNLEM